MNVQESTELPASIDEDDSNENFYEKQVLKLTTVASVSSILANILISFTIIRYKNLRTNVTHSIILHIVLVQILSLVFDEILLWFFTYYGAPLPQYHTAFCSIFVGVRIMNAVSFLLIMVLVFNWYIKLFHHENTYARFCRYHKILLFSTYLTGIVMFPFLTKTCLRRDVYATFFVVLSFQIVMILLSLYMNIVPKWKRRHSFENDVGLGVANVLVTFCTPAYVFLILVYYNLVPVYIVLLADILATGVFPFVLIYMYKKDKNFQMYFRRLFTCNTGIGEDQIVAYNLINNVKI